MTWISISRSGYCAFKDPDNRSAVRFSHREPLQHTTSVIDFAFDDDDIYIADLSNEISVYSLRDQPNRTISRGPQNQFVALHGEYLALAGSDPVTSYNNTIDLLHKETLVRKHYFPSAQYITDASSHLGQFAVATLGTGCILASLWTEAGYTENLFDLLEEDFVRFAGDAGTGGAFLLSRSDGGLYLSAWTRQFEHLWSERVHLDRETPMGIFVGEELVWLSSGRFLHCFAKDDGSPSGQATLKVKLDGLHRRFETDLIPHTFNGVTLERLSSLEFNITQDGALKDHLSMDAN